MAACPRGAAGLLREHGLRLLAIAAATAVVHELLLVGGGRLAAQRPLAALVAAAAAIIVSIVGLALMFLVVRSSLAGRAIVATDERVPVVVRDEPLADAAFAVALPFLVFYGAWGLFAADVSDLVARSIWDGSGQPRSPLQQPVGVLAAVAAVALVLRVLLDRLGRRRRRGILRLAAAGFEAMWLVFAFAIAFQWQADVRHWVIARRAWQAGERSVDAIHDVLAAVSGPLQLVADRVADLFASLGRLVVAFQHALVEPALWLTIAAIAVGCELERGRERERHGRLPRLRRAFEGMPAPVRGSIRLASEQLREKYVPLVDGARMVAAAGLLPFLVVAFWYGLVVLAEARLDRLVVVGVVGNMSASAWQPATELLGGVVDLMGTAARVAILAAGLDLLLAGLVQRARRGDVPASAQPEAAST